MDYAATVRGSECVGNLQPDEYGSFQIEWATGDELSHILSLDVLHGNEVHTVHFIEIKDCADVRVIERGRKSRFAFESF
jgi:hypothetical protein